MGSDERKGGIKRAGVDPMVEAWQKKAAENTAALSQRQRSDRNRVRVKYDMPESLKETVTAIGDRWDTSASQAAQMLLAWAVIQLAAGRAPELLEAVEAGREVSRTPRFEWNIEIPDAWHNVFEHFWATGTFNGDVNGDVEKRLRGR